MIELVIIGFFAPLVVALIVLLIKSKNQAILLKNKLALEREVEDINRRRATAEGFYDNVLEANISQNLLLGDNAKDLLQQLSLPEDATYSECIDALIAQFVKEPYQELYKNNFDRINLLRRYNGEEATLVFEFEERDNTADYHWTRVSVCIYYSQIDDCVKIVSYVKNIQDEKEKELQLMREANTDYLTGLYNMRAAAQLTYELLYKSHEEGSECAQHALMIIDLDHFKLINDTVGHAGGDKILTLVAQALRNNMCEGSIVARIGGDEFMIIMSDILQETAMEKSQQITQMITQLDTVAYEGVFLSISIGVAMYPSHADNYSDLFNMADGALYQAKQNGRNTSVLFGTY